MNHKRNAHTTNLARGLRKRQTDAEKQLWYQLRDRQIAGAKFRRQVPVGRYILDFYCFEHKICMQLDGSQHSFEENASRDAERDAYLAAEGITVLRFWNHEVYENIEGVLFEIAKSIMGVDAAGELIYGG